jgi:hypothetical protein
MVVSQRVPQFVARGTPTEQPLGRRHTSEELVLCVSRRSKRWERPTDPSDLSDGQFLERPLYGREEKPMEKSRFADEQMVAILVAILREKRA